jgi:hypothetical protein
MAGINGNGGGVWRDPAACLLRWSKLKPVDMCVGDTDDLKREAGDSLSIAEIASLPRIARTDVCSEPNLSLTVFQELRLSQPCESRRGTRVSVGLR